VVAAGAAAVGTLAAAVAAAGTGAVEEEGTATGPSMARRGGLGIPEITALDRGS
jgi:hypothetical protein